MAIIRLYYTIIQRKQKVKRKRARVDEWDSLENCCARKGTGGSNPPASAMNNSKQVLIVSESSRDLALAL